MNKFCANCGTELKEGFNVCPNCGQQINKTAENNNANPNRPNVLLAERNIALAIVLTLITCGIYGVYWFIVMTDESNKVSGDTAPTGGMAFLFTLLTCGIYSFYWSYKMGQKMHQAGQMHGKEIADNSILYLILSLFGFGIINYCLIQNDLNKFA